MKIPYYIFNQTPLGRFRAVLNSSLIDLSLTTKDLSTSPIENQLVEQFPLQIPERTCRDPSRQW